MIIATRIPPALVPAAIAFAAASACSAPDQSLKIAAAPDPASAPTGTTQSGPPGADSGVANLPYARGRVFYSLDEYLAYLEKQGAIDLPWWREISPGVYERVTRGVDAEREIATREELMRRFGFQR